MEQQNDQHPPRKKLRLDQFLKLQGLVSTGGEAKFRIQNGEVQLNGEVETRRGRGLRPGDVIEIEGRQCTVTDDLWKDSDSAPSSDPGPG